MAENKTVKSVKTMPMADMESRKHSPGVPETAAEKAGSNSTGKKTMLSTMKNMEDTSVDNDSGGMKEGTNAEEARDAKQQAAENKKTNLAIAQRYPKKNTATVL